MDGQMDGRTDGQMDGHMEKPSYRNARCKTHLRIVQIVRIPLFYVFCQKRINQSIHKVIKKWTKIDLCICKDTLSPEKRLNQS